MYVSLFDRACLTHITAVKAIWLLYRRGRWDLLRSIGMKRGQCESVFRKFEDAGLFGRGGRLRSAAQARALMRMYPPIVDAATRLIGLYLIALGDEIPEVERATSV